MPNLRNIMIATDLRESACESVIEQALRLMNPGTSKINLVHVLDVPERIKSKMQSQAETPEQKGYQELLDRLAAQAKTFQEQGVETTSSILFGKVWVSLIEEVLRSKPDLLLAGPAYGGPIKEALLGSTTSKLLRKCPCPVWVTRPRDDDKVSKRILVAHDLSSVGRSALSWGAELSHREKSELHVLHCIKSEDYFRFMATVPSSVIEAQRTDVRTRLEAETRDLELTTPPHIEIALGSPQVEIFNYLKEHSIDLLIMGTVARAGIAAIITGNTAETLLPWVRCSLIALKPDDFVCPVSVGV